jgi:hypothetical protein
MATPPKLLYLPVTMAGKSISDRISTTEWTAQLL